MKILNQFLLISTISLFTLGFIFDNVANAQEVAPALPTMVSADPFYWAEGGFGIDVLRSFEMPLDPYLTPGVTSDSSNQEILDGYFEANPDLIAEIIVPEEQRAKNYVVTFFDGDFAQGITVTSFSKFIAPDAFSDSLEFHLQGLPSKDKEKLYEHIHDWFTQGFTLQKFSALIDVVSPDDTVLQTWEFTKCKITDYVILQQDSKLVVSFRQEFNPEYREQISLSCEGFFLHTEQKTNQVSLESSLPTKEDSVQAFIVRFHEGKIQEPTTFTTFSKFSHLSTVELELPVGKISIPMPGGTFEGKPQFILESLPSKDKEKLYQFAHNWLTQVTSPEPIDVDVEFVTGDGTIIQTWEYTECDLLDFQIFSDDNLVSYRFTGKLPTELRDISHFECNGLDFNTEQGPSELKSVPVNALDLIPDDASRAQIYIVKFFEGKIAEPRVFTTFSKFIHVAPTIENTAYPFLSRDRPQFTLESLPSSDKAELYQAVNNWLTQETSPEPVDVQIEAVTGDGTVLLTYEYEDCDIITYEPYLNDNFLAYKFTGEFKMEIRDKTSFDCSGYNINPEQRKSSYTIESSNNFQTFLPENSQRAQAYLVTFSSGYFETDKTFTTFSKFTPSDVFDGKQITFTLESLTSKDKKIFYDEVTRWRTQNTFLKEFEAKVDVLVGDGTILQRWHYSECGITDFKGFLVDDLLRMKHTYGMLPELRDKTYFNCKGFSLNVDQQKSSIANSFETIIPEELVSSKEDRAQGFFVTASGGPLAEAITTAEFAKFIPINEGESGIPLPGSTFYGSKDLILSGLPTKNKVNGYAAIETWMKEQAFDPFDVHVGVISGDGTLLQNWAYIDCDFENYVTFLYHSIIFTTYSMEPGKEIRGHMLLNCVGFDLEFKNKPTSFSSETSEYEISELTPLDQISFGIDPKNIQCKEGKTLMSKPLQNSGGCIIDSHVSKMQERGWILVPQQGAQTLGTISQLDFIPIDTDRAKSFNVKFFDGNFEDGLVLSTFSNFYPFTDLQFAGIKIPNYPFGSKPQFMLESLLSKDKQAFYNEVNIWKDKAAHHNSFEVIVDVITEDGTVLQTWNYFDCEITGYEMLLDENLLLVKYHDQWQPEIVDKSKFSCQGLDFKAGI